jgi:hypothetical protein
MIAMNRLQGLLLCGALTAFVGIAQAQTMPEDATTRMDEAAEAEAKKAEAVAEEQARKMQEAADIEKADVRGEPMEEVEVSGEE